MRGTHFIPIPMSAGSGEPLATGPGLGSADLDRLDPEDFRTLAYASAVGQEVDFDLMAEAMGAEPEQLAERIERLVRSGVLKERLGGGRFAFVDDEYRARVYQSMTASRLRVIHAKLGATLERRNPSPSDAVIAELGRHFFLGRVPAKAWEYNWRAARRAEEEGRIEDAIHELDRARDDLAALPNPPSDQLAQIDERLGNLHRTRGRMDQADAAYVAALDRLSTQDRQARARLLLARADMARQSTRPQVAEGLGTEALEISTAIGDLRGQAAAHRIRGRMAFERGQFATALDEAMIALDFLQRVGDRVALGECCTDIALAFSVMGPEVEEDSIRWLRRSVEILESTEDRYATLRAYSNLAAAVGRTDPVQALELLERSRQIAEKIASPQSVVRALLAATEFHLALGEVDAAERDYQQAARLLERITDPRGRQYLLASRGMIAERRGRWEEAERAYRDAALLAEQVVLPAAHAESEYRLARLLYKTRDMDGAREAYRRAEALHLRRLRPVLAPALDELGRQLGALPAAPVEVAPARRAL